MVEFKVSSAEENILRRAKVLNTIKENEHTQEERILAEDRYREAVLTYAQATKELKESK
jgi:hypothetical protein